MAAVFLLTIVWTGSYRRVERVAIALGLFELVFIWVALQAPIDPRALAHGLASVPAHHPGFLYLVAANIGAVIMPWMVFYQQGAIVDKGLVRTDRRAERRDTLVGAVVTQVITIAVVVAFAATDRARTRPLTSVAGMARALAGAIGAGTSRALVGAAVLGGSLLAALVVSLAASWGISEVLGWRHSLNEGVGRHNRRFYLTYVAAHVLGAVLVLASVDLVNLAIDVEVLNALLLPVVLVMLALLEHRALPEGVRLQGAPRILTTATMGIVVAFGFLMIPGVLAHWG